MEKVELTPIARLNRDLTKAAATLTDDEARYLVDYYYIAQEDRKRADNQVRALGRSKEPATVLDWLAAQADTIETQIKKALDVYTKNHKMGSWMREVYGIGPVLSAGLLAHIDITKAPTVGHIWRYAGLDPTVKWEKGQKRPWNAALKTLCWKVGQSFMKMSNSEECYYGQYYKKRKQYEIERNLLGGNREEAAKGTLRVGKDTEAYKWYAGCYTRGMAEAYLGLDSSKKQEFLKVKQLEEGLGVPMLPPAQIDGRARRWAVKLFLSHMHNEWYLRHYGKPAPLPYPIAILKHAHLIEYPQARADEQPTEKGEG